MNRKINKSTDWKYCENIITFGVLWCVFCLGFLGGFLLFLHFLGFWLVLFVSVFVFDAFLFLFWFRYSFQLKLTNDQTYFAQLCAWQMLSCRPESVPKSLAKPWPWTCSCHSLHSLTLPPLSASFKTTLWNSSSASYWAWQLLSDEPWSCVLQRCPWLSHSFFSFLFLCNCLLLFWGRFPQKSPPPELPWAMKCVRQNVTQ